MTLSACPDPSAVADTDVLTSVRGQLGSSLPLAERSRSGTVLSTETRILLLNEHGKRYDVGAVSAAPSSVLGMR